jgi:hypothetical protein
MTDLATALADNSALQPYRGRDVLRTTIAVRNAGDGLSEALGIDPQELAIGSKVVLVLECEVKGHDYEPIPNTQALVLKQVLRAGTATLIDADVVREALHAQRERIDKAKAEASGQPRMIDTSGQVTPEGDVTGNPDEEPEDEVLLRHHAAGRHSEGPVEGCAACANDQAREDEVAAKRAAKQK